MNTNGKHPKTLDPHWQVTGRWWLCAIQDGKTVLLDWRIYPGIAEDANRRAAFLAEMRGLEAWFLCQVKPQHKGSEE